MKSDLSPLGQCQLSLAEEGDGISDKTLETKFMLFIQLPHSKIEFFSGPDLQQEITGCSKVWNKWTFESLQFSFSAL